MVFTSLTDSEPFISFFCNVSWWRGNRLLSQEINDTGSDGHRAPWVTVRHLLSILGLMLPLEVTLWFISGVVVIDTLHHYGLGCWELAEWSVRVVLPSSEEAESINKTTPPGPGTCHVSIILLRSNPMMNHHDVQNIYNENQDPGMGVAFKYLNAYFSVTAQTEGIWIFVSLTALQ